MAYQRKTWKQKLQVGHPAKVEQVDRKFADIPAGATMLVANPEIVDRYIRAIPFGTHTSLLQMRKDLAATYNADHTCPLTAGIFLRIVAEAAWEEMAAGKSIEEVSPFWRMIDRKTPAAKKLTFGTEFVAAQRIKEGLYY